jgi:hypothetical protein
VAGRQRWSRSDTPRCRTKDGGLARSIHIMALEGFTQPPMGSTKTPFFGR